MKFFTILIIILSFYTAQAQAVKEPDKKSGAKIEFVKDVFDYGNIYANSGHDGMAEFKFINTGTEPLVLTNVKASCGCTSPYWQKEPVLPGDTGKVVLKYNSITSPHTINKSAVISSNAINNPSAIIRITGTVLAQPEVMWPEKNIDKTASPFAP